jgi:hypothetical protein
MRGWGAPVIVAAAVVIAGQGSEPDRTEPRHYRGIPDRRAEITNWEVRLTDSNLDSKLLCRLRVLGRSYL